MPAGGTGSVGGGMAGTGAGGSAPFLRAVMRALCCSKATIKSASGIALY